MSDNPETLPSTNNLCGDFTTPANPDTGRSYSAPIARTCEAPDVTIDGGAEVVFVDGEPQSLELEE